MTHTLPDIDSLWDFSNPASTEKKFRELLPVVERSRDEEYHAELLTQLARSQGLQRQFDLAHATLDRLEPLLVPDMARAQIRYLLERGRVFNSSRHKEQARPLFLKAATLAEATSEYALYVDALHMLAIVDPPERAIDWNLTALGAAEKSADPKARQWRAPLCNNIGWTYHDDLEDYPRALVMFEKALAARREQGDPVAINIARWCVGRCYRSLGRLDEALAIQRDLEVLDKNTGGSDGFVDEELAELLTLQGKPDEARPYFAAAYSKLSKDEWFKKAEPARLERMKTLGNVGEIL